MSIRIRRAESATGRWQVLVRYHLRDTVQRNGNQFSWLVWIGILVPAFSVPERCSAQQAAASLSDIVRIPIIEGRDIRFRKLHNPQNLSHVRVESIVQDTQGFMWFATWNGLNRYDGYKFRLFKHEAGDPNSLSGVYAYALFKDHSGTVWVGTEGFLDRFHPETETFTHYRLDNPAPKGLSSVVNHITQDSSGTLWVSTRNGLFRLDPQSGELKTYVHDSADPSTLADNTIRSSGEDRQGNFWVATSRTLDEFDRQTGKVKRHIQVFGFTRTDLAYFGSSTAPSGIWRRSTVKQTG